MTIRDLSPRSGPGGAGHALVLACGPDDRIAADIAVRRALARADAAPARRLGRWPSGAPRVLRHDGTDAAIALSLSHRAARAAALVAPAGWRVGVDLERTGLVRPEHARYYLSAAERAAAPQFGLDALWSLKEAAWKALELDATTPFAALRLVLADGGLPAALTLHDRPIPVMATLSRPWPGWLLATVRIAPTALAALERAA